MSKLMPILNQLYAGKKITLQFPSKDDRETFRQNLYKIKKTQDDALVAVLDEEKMILHSNGFNKYIFMGTEYTQEEMDNLVIKNGMGYDDLEESDLSVLFYAKFWLGKKKETAFEIINIEEVEPVKESDDGRTSFEKEISESLGEVASRLPDQSSEKSSGSST